MSNEKVNFKLGDRVMTIRNSKPLYGTVRTIGGNDFETVAIVNVETDNPNEGEVIKVRVSDLILVQETEVKKTEPVEKTSITITPSEFTLIGLRVIAKVIEKNPRSKLVFTTFLAELHKALFFGEVNENS